MVASYNLRPGYGAGLFSKEKTRKEVDRVAHENVTE